MNVYRKYPRTYHLGWTGSKTSDDRTLKSVEYFIGKEIIVTCKLDGENTSMYSDHIHARSIDSKHHPSRNWIKTLHGQIKHEIPKGFRLCGENMFAFHSIYYRNLESYFYVFAIYDENNICLSWDDTVNYANMLGLITVPVLYRGIWDEEKVKNCWTGNSAASPGDPQEGYVVRVANAFPYEEQDEGCFSKYTAKMVRKDHVSTDEHWLTKPVVPNLLRNQKEKCNA